MKPIARLAALALAAGAAAACTMAGYRSDCYEIITGSFVFDAKSGQWSFGGLCIERIVPACPDLKNFRFEAGVDDNGNGVLDQGEHLINVQEDDPQSNSICAAASSGHIGAGKKGRRIMWHYECSKEGQSLPFVSRSGEIEID